MTTQRDLFSTTRELLAQPVKALARASDPISSHEAAEKMVSSGAAKRQGEMVLDLLFRQPYSTTHELASLSNVMHKDDALDSVQIGRRLPYMQGAETAGLRVCRVTRRKCQMWRPK